ncbi:MAG: SDR family oxidoreductase [Gammaproteobacteria bacterium]|nr:SDR family oxidoreductase [Gammaproteobacteria bacterium]MDX2461564.1 SDR family oxidoreductase [Gammaproteobacteria bacterium]
MVEVAVVTGASRGIGAAVARLLGSHGYRVCVNYRAGREAADAVAADIVQAGGEALAVQADVADRDAVRRLFETVDDQLGPLTALVNNAGIHGPRGRVDALGLDALEEVLAVNVVGLVACSQEAVRRMSTRYQGSGGAIVNISSGAAYIGGAGDGVHYAVSKGAVNSFTIGLSQEVAGEGIRVNAVSPGLTRTDMPDPAALERGPSIIPMGRVGDAEEIAEAVLWLLSDRASFVAGANIRVAGGRP